jgi:hypothetical protein
MYGGEYGALECASAADTVAKDALVAGVIVPLNNVHGELQVEGKEGEGKGEEETQQVKGAEDHSDHSSECDNDNDDDLEEWEHYKSGPFGGSAGKGGTHKRDEDFLKLEAAFTSLGLDSKVTSHTT